jgi:amidase
MQDDRKMSGEGEPGALGASELAGLIERGELSSVEVVEQLIGRIEAIDPAGARAGSGAVGLRSVLELAPDALGRAAQLDAERVAGHVRSPVHGLPVLVKDNVDTVAPLHTTAGSLVFGDSHPGSDATIVSALRDAGAIVLGKTNLSEWANFRSRPSSSGWSGAGGQTRNPHALDRSPGGSSAGSGAAVAARLAPFAIGTETDGSILCPAAACGVMGLKPTVGLVSRTGIVPISQSQDTAGPMARCVEDLALLLEVLAKAVDDGEDSAAVSSARPPGHEPHYVALLGDGNLRGVRVGVLRAGGYGGYHPPTDRVFESALAALKETGADVVEGIELPNGPLSSGEDEMIVLTHEYRSGLERYLARRALQSGGSGEAGLPRSVQDVIDHIEATPGERPDVFGTELMARAAATDGVEAHVYREARERNLERSRAKGLDLLFQDVDVLVLPAMSPAWVIDHVVGDAVAGAGWSPPAVAGYPSATMPVGAVGGLPVGIALWGPPWSEARLLEVMFALERSLGPGVTSPVPAFVTSVSIRG